MGAHILIVEDNAEFADNLREILGNFGCDAEVAGSAEEAIDLLQRKSFSGVLTDHRLPGKSGLELLEEMANSDRRTKAVMMSAFADDDVQSRALRAGATKVMAKPVDMESLAEVLAAFAA